MHIIVFACPHGAGKSRAAAALFASAGLPGWRAVSVASDEPDPVVSTHVAGLLAGTGAEPFLDTSAPHLLADDEAAADRIVAIDCEVPSATSWQLVNVWPDPLALKEIQERVAILVEELR